MVLCNVKIMEKYNTLTRILIVFPMLLVMGLVWAVIGLFSTNSLGEVLQETGKRLLKK